MKLLLIMPQFFDYPQVIREELESMGWQVDFFDDRPSTHALVKAAIRVNKHLLHTYIRRYFARMMRTVRNTKYDAVLLISGQSLSLSEDMMRQLRESQPQARFVLYQWDSLRNFPYIARMQKYFDRCYTFDPQDARDNPNLHFLPLFYSARYEKLGAETPQPPKYDFCFVGTAHPKKYKLIRKMSEELRAVYPRQFVYFFYPSPLVYYYRKLRNPELRKAKRKEFHFVPLKEPEMMEVFRASRSVMDSAQSAQAGLTIRVLEALGAKKKLITTNPDIVNYDFYRPENIYVYDGRMDLNHVFFQKPYRELEDEIYQRYSLRSWLTELLQEEVDSVAASV